ncbi:RHS repeat-associated core domain-containing protein [Catenovulum sediminis]|uniref:RHS repeat-associated core domain-containing protein n=1 Tax=Catenovulum sediminis TaxID=1740262 RepID=A0ABV1REB6_9ALTE
MQARYYDPVIGRFLSNDPVGYSNVHNFNRYAYGNNNPYKFIDPDGREVRAIYNSGQLSVYDQDTKKRIVISAESGGKPFGKPIESGKYDILSHPDGDFFRLEPKDDNYGDDTHEKTGRDEFRLHRPGLTIGCIAATDSKEWDSVKDVLNSTSTSKTEVDSKSRNPLASDKEPSTKYGELWVKKPKEEQ